MFETNLTTERPSVPPATAVSCVSGDLRTPFDAVTRRRLGFVVPGAVDTAHQFVEVLTVRSAEAANGWSLSAPVGGYVADARQMGNKQIGAGVTGVGGCPPRGRPN